MIEGVKLTLSNDTCRDNGKPYTVSLAEDVKESISVLRYGELILLVSHMRKCSCFNRYYAGWSDKVFGRTIDVGPTKLAYTLHQPVGVCGQIIPYAPISLHWYSFTDS